MLEVIKTFWPIAFGLSSLLAVAYARWINRENVSKATVEALEHRVADLEKQLIHIDTKLDNLPTSHDFQSLSKDLAHMAGQFEGFGMVISRLHEHMLERSSRTGISQK